MVVAVGNVVVGGSVADNTLFFSSGVFNLLIKNKYQKTRRHHHWLWRLSILRQTKTLIFFFFLVIDSRTVQWLGVNIKPKKKTKKKWQRKSLKYKNGQIFCILKCNRRQNTKLDYKWRVISVLFSQQQIPKFQNGERLHQTERRAKVEFKQQQQQRNRKQECLPKTTNIWVNGMYWFVCVCVSVFCNLFFTIGQLSRGRRWRRKVFSPQEMPQYQSTFYCCHICVFVRNSFQRILSPFILFDVVYCVLLPTISLS